MAEKYFKVYPDHYRDYSAFKDSVNSMYISYHLMQRGGDKTKTARELGIKSRSTLYNNLESIREVEVFVQHAVIFPSYSLPIRNKPITLPNLEDKDEEYKLLANLYVGYFDESYIYTIGDIKIIKELAARFRSYGEGEYEKAEDLEDLVEVLMKDFN